MNLDALYKLTHGLYVLGAKDGDRFVGSIVDAVMQVANKPVVIALSCSNTSYTKGCIDRSKEFSLSVLCKKIDPFIVANFGFQTSKNVNKWDKADYCVKDGLPYLKDNIATFRCKVIQETVFDSNTLFVAEVIEADDSKNEDPLTYLDYRSYFKSDVLKSFEKFIKKQETPMTDSQEQKTSPEAEKHWICTVCGYIYDGDTPFEDLPDDWVCPTCGVDKSFFEYK